MTPGITGVSGTSPMIGLALLVGLFVLAIWVLKRVQAPRLSRSKHLAVLDAQPIGPGQQLLIVRAGEQTLLIGSSSQSVNLICSIDTLPDDLSTRNGVSDRRTHAGFTQVLASLMRR